MIAQDRQKSDDPFVPLVAVVPQAGALPEPRTKHHMVRALFVVVLVLAPAVAHAQYVPPAAPVVVEEPPPGPPEKHIGLLLQLGSHGLGIEAALDMIPYVQIAVGGSGSLDQERGRIVVRARIPVERAQFIGGIGYAKGSYSTFCFMCHEPGVEGPIRAIHTEIGFDVTFWRYLRFAVHGGLEWLLSEPIVDAGETVVKDRGAYLMLGVGLSL